MYLLLKVDKLKKYRFFESFRWDDKNCNCFSKTNVVYGWNGCGKSTLCDFFRDLEIGSVPDETEYRLVFQDTSDNSSHAITDKEPDKIPYSIRVLDQEYIQNNLPAPTGIKHIFSLGAAQKEDIALMEKLEKEISDYEQIRLKLVEAEAKERRRFETYCTTRAGEIREVCGYKQSFDRNALVSRYSEMKKPSDINLEDYVRCQAIKNSSQSESVDEVIFKFNKMQFVEQGRILSEKPMNVKIDWLKDDEELSRWVKDGLKIHNARGTCDCLYCGNKFSSERKALYESAFNDSFQKLSEGVIELTNLLETMEEYIQDFSDYLPDGIALFSDIRERYIIEKAETIKKIKNNKNALKEAIKVVAKKSNDISQDYQKEYLDAIKKMVELDDDISNMNLLIKEHNERNNNIVAEKKMAVAKLEAYELSKTYSEYQKKFESYREKECLLENNNKELEDKEGELHIVRKRVRSEQIPAENINSDITKIIGRSELKFVSENEGYSILRDDKQALKISRGEMNALSLVYFFNSLEDADFNIKNSIIILDDPISSFDSNYYYSLLGYIVEKLENAGQVIIFTHNFQFLRDLSREKMNKFIIKRLDNKPIILTNDPFTEYDDEYSYLFGELLKIKDSRSFDVRALIYPNVARRVLEGYLTFKVPQEFQKDSLGKRLDILCKDKSDIDKGTRTALKRLLNEKSHIDRVCSGGDYEDIACVEDFKNILEAMFNLINRLDPEHYKAFEEKHKKINNKFPH